MNLQAQIHFHRYDCFIYF